MGFFDIFKKQPKNKKQEEPQTIMQPKRNDNQNIIEYSCTEDGRLVIELYETQPKKGQFYDTTKLVIDNKQVNLEGELLQNCMVTWYGQDDCVYLDDSKKDFGRRGQYKNVLAEIDTDVLQEDESYCVAVMRMLLNQNRVEEYLNRGLQDSPERPCGKYVGGIVHKENRYAKEFKVNLGRASHDSPDMVAKRERQKEIIRKSQERARADKQAKIAQLQQELEDMDAR